MAKEKEAESKLAGLLHREQLVADYQDQQAAAAKAAEAADQVGPQHTCALGIRLHAEFLRTILKASCAAALLCMTH